MNTNSAAVDPAGRLDRAVRLLVRRFSIAERADQACCGMTVAQAAALDALDEAGRLRAGDLGRRLGIAPSTLTRNVEKLETRGWVERSADPEDARAWTLSLTLAGRRAAQEVRARRDEFVDRVLGRIAPARRAAVLEALDELVGAVREATDACCPGAYDHLMRTTMRDGSRRARSER